MDLPNIEQRNCVNAFQFSSNLVTIRAYGDNWPGDYSQIASSSDIQPEVENSTESQDQNAAEADDTFGLEFAAVQYLNLVTNAEQLFNKLLSSIVLSGDEKEQIQRWLCLKQECEDCVASDEATSIGERHRQSLERIEELTENTDRSTNSFEKSTDSQYDSETESDFDSNHPDFEDKLDGYMERFKDKTDEIIRSKLIVAESVGQPPEPSCSLPFSVNTNHPYQTGRRKSLHPGSIPPLLNEGIERRNETEDSLQSEESETKPYCNAEFAKAETSTYLEPYKKLKLLSSGNDAKKTQIRQILKDLEEAHQRIEKLQHTIQIKEQFIKDMIKNSDTRNSAKLKFQRKWSKLEEEYYKTRTQLAQAEHALHETKHAGGHDAFHHKSEVEKFKSLARRYEKRLKDIDLIKKIPGDSAKKVLELENSLQDSKKQMDKLKKRLKKEESHKQRLEEELQEDQQRLKVLEEKYHLQMSTILDKEKKSESKGDGDRLKWIAEETERLNVMRESSQRLHKQLVQQQTALNNRETLLKEKLGMEKQRTKNIMEVNARISHLETILKEETVHENNDEKDEKENIRLEIHNLRKTRDHLLEQRSSLDEKYHKEQRLSSTDERRYLECAEAIEAIDAAIEYKNELICGRKGLDVEAQAEREQGEQLLMARLFQLSPDELRTLLYKYFQKVIDLRESGRRMEEQLDEAEQKLEMQAWRNQQLDHALQAKILEGERQLVAMQREHQEKVHLMLRHFAEESGSSGTEAGRHLLVSRDSENGKLKRENRAMRRRLQEMEALVQAAAASNSVMRLRSRSVSPEHRPMKQLPAPPATTKVTREKNKVIIRVSSTKKKTTKDVISFNHHK